MVCGLWLSTSREVCDEYDIFAPLFLLIPNSDEGKAMNRPGIHLNRMTTTVPLRTVNRRSVLRREEMRAGFCWGLHPAVGGGGID